MIGQPDQGLCALGQTATGILQNGLVVSGCLARLIEGIVDDHDPLIRGSLEVFQIGFTDVEITDFDFAAGAAPFDEVHQVDAVLQRNFHLGEEQLHDQTFTIPVVIFTSGLANDRIGIDVREFQRNHGIVWITMQLDLTAMWLPGFQPLQDNALFAALDDVMTP